MSDYVYAGTDSDSDADENVSHAEADGNVSRVDDENVKNVVANVRDLMAMDLASADKNKLRDLLVHIRKAVSVPQDPPISEVIQEDPMKVFVAILEDNDSTEDMIFETIWILTNIASGTSEQTKVVVESGALDAAMNHLEDSSITIAEQTLWLMGNVCGDCVENRDMILLAGGAKKVIAAYKKHATDGTTKVSFVNNLYWVVSNLVRGKPLPKMSLVSSLADFVVDQMVKIGEQSRDYGDYADILWAAAYLSDSDFFATKFSKSPAFVRAVIQKGILASRPDVRVPAVRTIGQLCSCEEKVTQAVIDAGAIPALARLYTRNLRDTLLREIMWVFSNITAGTRPQAEAVFGCNNTVYALLAGLSNEDNHVVREAVYAVSNPLGLTDCGGLLDGEMFAALAQAMVKISTDSASDSCFDAAAGTLWNFVIAMEKGSLSPEDCDAFDSVDWMPLMQVLEGSSSANASGLFNALWEKHDGPMQGGSKVASNDAGDSTGQVDPDAAGQVESVAGQLDRLNL